MKKFLLISILIFVQGASGQQKDKPTSSSSKPQSYLNSASSLKDYLPSSSNATDPSVTTSSSNATDPSGITDSSSVPSVNTNCNGQPCMMLPSSSSNADSSQGTAPNLALTDVSCQTAKTRVDTICIGNKNPDIMKKVSAIAAISTAGLSLINACSKFNSLLADANDVIIAYNSACAAAGYYCQKTCQSAASIAQDNSIAAYNAKNMPAGQRFLDIHNADNATGTNCEASMKKNLIDAGIGVLGIAATSVLGKECTDKTSDDSSTTKCDPTTNNQCISGIDCSATANATNPTCICNATPSTPGCPGATSYGGSGYSSTTYGSTTSNTGGTNSTVSGTGAGTSSPAAVRSQTTPASADGSTSGSGSGSSGGFGGAISGDSIAQKNDESKKGQTADKKGLNTNILSGDEGGGGGGYRGSRGGSGDSNYNAYMPGQKNDPSRALASQNAVSSQVTSAGSKSNWEKISERYTENKSTLMGD